MREPSNTPSTHGSNELLPCPFDAGRAERRTEWGSIRPRFFIACGQCLVATQLYATEAQAVDAWNTRAPSPAPAETEACRCGHKRGQHDAGDCRQCSCFEFEPAGQSGAGDARSVVDAPMSAEGQKPSVSDTQEKGAGEKIEAGSQANTNGAASAVSGAGAGSLAGGASDDDLRRPDARLAPGHQSASAGGGSRMNPLFDSLGAVRLIVSPAIGGQWQQFRFPRSKRARIRKKWARDFRNKRWSTTG